MEKVALLTASKVEPSVSIHPRPKINRLLSPTLRIAFQFQRLLSAITIFVYLWILLLVRAAYISVVFVGKLLAAYAFLTAKSGVVRGSSVSSEAIVRGWNSKRVERLREKLWYEFAIFMLGGGYFVMMIVLWPGWWLVGGAYLGIRLLIG